MAFTIVNKNDPFTEPYSQQVTLLREAHDYASSKKDHNTAHVIAAYMWIKVNYAELRTSFEKFKTIASSAVNFDDVPNLVYLGSSVGVPLHLENYSTVESFDAAMHQLITEVETAISWAKTNTSLEDVGPFNVGCCLESHTRGFLSHIGALANLIPPIVADLFIKCSSDKLYDSFAQLIKHVGLPVIEDLSSVKTKFESKEKKVESLSPTIKLTSSDPTTFHDPISSKTSSMGDEIKEVKEKKEEKATRREQKEDFVPDLKDLQVQKQKSKAFVAKIFDQVSSRLEIKSYPLKLERIVRGLKESVNDEAENAKIDSMASYFQPVMDILFKFRESFLTRARRSLNSHELEQQIKELNLNKKAISDVSSYLSIEEIDLTVIALASAGAWDLLSCLLDNENRITELSYKDPVSGETALYKAVEAVVTKKTEGLEVMLYQLVERGADPLATDEYGASPLGNAAWGRRKDVMRLLIQKDKDKLDIILGKVVLELVRLQRWVAVRYVLKLTRTITPPVNKESIFYSLYTNNQNDLIKLYLEKITDGNERGTALFYLVKGRKWDLVHDLMKKVDRPIAEVQVKGSTVFHLLAETTEDERVLPMTNALIISFQFHKVLINENNKTAFQLALNNHKMAYAKQLFNLMNDQQINAEILQITNDAHFEFIAVELNDETRGDRNREALAIIQLLTTSFLKSGINASAFNFASDRWVQILINLQRREQWQAVATIFLNYPLQIGPENLASFLPIFSSVLLQKDVEINLWQILNARNKKIAVLTFWKLAASKCWDEALRYKISMAADEEFSCDFMHEITTSNLLVEIVQSVEKHPPDPVSHPDTRFLCYLLRATLNATDKHKDALYWQLLSLLFNKNKIEIFAWVLVNHFDFSILGEILTTLIKNDRWIEFEIILAYFPLPNIPQVETFYPVLLQKEQVKAISLLSELVKGVHANYFFELVHSRKWQEAQQLLAMNIEMTFTAAQLEQYTLQCFSEIPEAEQSTAVAVLNIFSVKQSRLFNSMHKNKILNALTAAIKKHNWQIADALFMNVDPLDVYPPLQEIQDPKVFEWFINHLKEKNSDDEKINLLLAHLYLNLNQIENVMSVLTAKPALFRQKLLFRVIQFNDSKAIKLFITNISPDRHFEILAFLITKQQSSIVNHLLRELTESELAKFLLYLASKDDLDAVRHLLKTDYPIAKNKDSEAACLLLQSNCDHLCHADLFKLLVNKKIYTETTPLKDDALLSFEQIQKVAPDCAMLIKKLKRNKAMEVPLIKLLKAKSASDDTDALLFLQKIIKAVQAYFKIKNQDALTEIAEQLSNKIAALKNKGPDQTAVGFLIGNSYPFFSYKHGETVTPSQTTITGEEKTAPEARLG